MEELANKDQLVKLKKKAVHAILMVKPTSKIELYKFKSELAIALPISGLDEDAAEEILESEGK